MIANLNTVIILSIATGALIIYVSGRAIIRFVRDDKLNRACFLIAVIAIVFVLIGAWSFWIKSGYTAVTLSEDMDNGTTAAVIEKIDRNDSVVVASGVMIENDEGELLNVIDWEDSDNGEDEVISRFTSRDDWKDSNHVIWEEDTIKDDNLIYIGNMTYKWYAVLAAGAIFLAPLITILVIERERFKRKQYESEMKKIKLESI